MKLKCPKCKHEWETKSKLVYVTCPSCHYKIKVINIITKKNTDNLKS